MGIPHARHGHVTDPTRPGQRPGAPVGGVGRSGAQGLSTMAFICRVQPPRTGPGGGSCSNALGPPTAKRPRYDRTVEREVPSSGQATVWGNLNGLAGKCASAAVPSVSLVMGCLAPTLLRFSYITQYVRQWKPCRFSNSKLIGGISSGYHKYY